VHGGSRALVARRHATLVVDGLAVTPHDLGTHNGTFVNNEPVRATRVLAEGDEGRVGPARLILRTAPASAGTLTDPDAR